MTPGTLVLLGLPWSGSLRDALCEAGLHVVVPDPGDAPEAGARYVAGTALQIAAAGPRPPLVLVAGGAAGALLPAVGAAQRAAHRLVGAYVFVDAELPVPAGDWPDAPCGYLATSAADPRLRAAELRAWPTAETTADSLAPALQHLISDL